MDSKGTDKGWSDVLRGKDKRQRTRTRVNKAGGNPDLKMKSCAITFRLTYQQMQMLRKIAQGIYATGVHDAARLIVVTNLKPMVDQQAAFQLDTRGQDLDPEPQAVKIAKDKDH